MEPSLSVSLQVPEIAQTAITHICPDQGEIKKKKKKGAGASTRESVKQEGEFPLQLVSPVR